MTTKEERRKMRERHEAAIDRINRIENLTYPIRISLQDVPALLDDIEERDAALNIAFDECIKAKAERDALKKQVEALERALKQWYACETCVYFVVDEECNAPCELSDGYGNWTFDKARFAGGDGE